MQEFWSDFFRGDYMPHGHCYMWQPGILWGNVVSDLVIALAYFSIPITLLFMVQKRKEQKFKGVFILFALFILSCGITHVFSVYTIWHGSYGLHGILKAITAIFSVITAFVLFRNVDNLIAIPTPTELKIAQEYAAEEQVKRMRLEVESRANSIFQFSIELFPTGVLVVDCDQKIQITNKILEETFGYSKEELVNQNITLLIEPELVENHKVLAGEFIKNPSPNKEMAAGRVVWGITKSGNSVPVEITLTVHEFENEKYTFASIVSVNEVGVEKKKFLETSRRIQRAVDATDVGIWEWNLLLDKAWFSPKFISFLSTNKSSEDLIFEDWMTHIHPEDIAKVRTNLAEHLQGNSNFDVFYRGINNKGEYKWLRAIGDTIIDASGKAILMSGTLTSVDQLKTLQMQMQSKNQFLDAVLSHSNSAIFIINITHKQLTFTNKQVEYLWGYTNEHLEELTSVSPAFSIIHPEDLPTLSRHIAELKDANLDEKFSIELRIKHKQGHWVWSLLNNSVYSKDEDGNTCEIMGAAIDLTEIKVREESNKRLSKEFLDTFEQAAVGIAHVGLDGSWLKVNQRICEILGYTRDELLQKTFQDITFPADLERDEVLLTKLLNGESKNYSMDKRYIQGNGSIIWARLTVSVVSNEQASIDHFISVIEDISQQKQLEHDLLESNDELEQFAYVASHDLKEPLRTMQTYTSYLIKDLAANKTERVVQDKEFIDNASIRMTSLIDDLLQFSRIGNTELNLLETNLPELVLSIVNDLHTKISETKTIIHVEDTLPTVYTDPTHLRLAIQNLIQNAIKFSKKDVPPRVSISAEETEDNFLCIHVKDNGIGIAPAYQEQIFGLFKKLHTSEEYKGTGLGLAIVKKIMQGLGGNVSVTSTSGQGSTFTLKIPYCQQGN